LTTHLSSRLTSANIQQYRWSGGDNQRWRIERAGGGANQAWEFKK
jgi:hypothetical protein